MSDHKLLRLMSLHGLGPEGTEEVVSGGVDTAPWPWEHLCLNELSDPRASRGRISVWWHSMQTPCLVTWHVMQFEMEL